MATERITAIAGLLICGTASQATPPTPTPLEEIPSSIKVRQFITAVGKGRFEDGLRELDTDAVLVTSKGTQRAGSQAIVKWFRTEFDQKKCAFLTNFSPGHWNDNSILYGQDEVMVEYRPMLCLPPSKTNPTLSVYERNVVRFVTPLNGPIALIEIVPPPKLPPAVQN
jgi:hypothetical protein